MSDNLTQTTERFLALDLDTQRAALAQFLHRQLLRLRNNTSKEPLDADDLSEWAHMLHNVPCLILNGEATHMAAFVEGFREYVDGTNHTTVSALAEAMEVIKLTRNAERERTQAS